MSKIPLRIFYTTVVLLQFLALSILPTFGQDDAEEANDVAEIYKDLKHETTPPPSHELDGWKDWETWQASPDIIQDFPYYRMGYDSEGRVVYVDDFGKWDYRELAEKPQAKIDEFWKYFDQMLKRRERDAKLNDNGGIVTIVNWDGFSLHHEASAAAIKLAMKMFTGMASRVDKIMPYGFYLNVNFAAESFINLCRPFLATMINKNEICGTIMAKCKPKLLQKIPADQLDPKFGGISADWKPLPFA